jgi:FtsP/CotA-like multicopper oxidase with cupredoxin domain
LYSDAANQYSFVQREISKQLHPQLPPTSLWAYDDGSGLDGQAGSFGLAVVAQTGTPVSMRFTNNLPATYPAWIPVDTRLTFQPNRVVRVMTHLHGGFVADTSDGSPAMTPGGFILGETQTVFYPSQAPQMPARCFGSTTTGSAPRG